MLLTLWVCGLIELYFADQTGITLQPYVPYGWQKKGHQVQIMCRTKSKRLNLFGLMRLDNHLTVYHKEQSITGEFIVESLTDFIGKVHSKPVVVVLDNGPIHRCQAVYDQQANWEEQDMYLFFLPTYSPHLNPIEILLGPPVRAFPKVSVVAEASLQFMESSKKSCFYYYSLIWPRISYLF